MLSIIPLFLMVAEMGMKTEPYIVGITGGSASGKSSFARELRSLFADDEMTVLCEDNYYLPKEKVPVDSNGVQNFDIPEAFDYPRYTDHIRNLKAGNAIEKEEYTFHKPGVVPRLLTYYSTPIIVVEGIFSLHYPEVKDLVDLKIFIDAEPETRYNRRVKRDAEERGLGIEDVDYRWHNHIMPCFEQNHSAYKASADVIILNNGDYQKGLRVIYSFLRNMLLTEQVK